MKDDDQIPVLNDKIQLLNDNLNLVYEFLVERSAQNDHHQRVMESEQFLIHSVLGRWKSLQTQQEEDTVPSGSGSGSGRPNGPSPSPSPITTPIEASNQSNQSNQSSQSQWRERCSTNHRATLSIAKEQPVFILAGGTSPGRSPKGKEPVVRKANITPSKNSQYQYQYPVLPKKRKLPLQALFSPTIPAPIPIPPAAVALSAFVQSAQAQQVNEIVFPFTLPPTTAIASANLDLDELPRTWTFVGGGDSVPSDSGDMEPPLYGNINTEASSTNLNSAYSEKSTQVTKEVLAQSYNGLVSRVGVVVCEVGEGSQVKSQSHVEKEKPAQVLVVLKAGVGVDVPPELESESESESQSRPPVLSPIITPKPRRAPSSSPRQPTQGFRKSSRTIRPSWKLNDSELPPPTSSSSPERTPKEEKVDKPAASSSSARRQMSRSRSRPPPQLSDQPPILTSQVELLKLNPGSGAGPPSRTLACIHCGKAFSTQHGLRYHLESHAQLKPFKCSVCFKSFGQKSTLTRHLATTHNKDKAHICGICKKCFSSASELTSHRGRHEAKRNICSVCRRGFIDKRYFKLHVKLCSATASGESGRSNGSNIEAGCLFQCSKCQKNYRDPHYFKKHVSLCCTN